MKEKFNLKSILLVLTAFSLMLLNFYFDFFPSSHGKDNFSDTLVSGTIYAEHYGVRRNTWSSLGRFSGLLGDMYDYTDFLTDENWEHGYNRLYPTILVRNTDFTKELFSIGNFVEFSNGEIFEIHSINDFQWNLGVCLKTDKVLTFNENGNLLDIKVKDKNGDYLELGKWYPYFSCFGLQGKVFRRLSRILNFYHFADYFHFLCSFFVSVVLVLISYFIYLKYDFIFSVVFYIVFLLSPWVISLAPNLYWIEFSLFLPMLIGLIISYSKNLKVEIFCYILMFIALFGKSLCGYEYLSTILISAVMFVTSDLIVAIFKKSKIEIFLNLRKVLLLSIIAVLGVTLAFVIHTYFLGNRNFEIGLIYQKANAARRILGTVKDFSNFHGREFEALFASPFETLFLYFCWTTQLIIGFDGNLFVPMIFITIIILIIDFINGDKNLSLISLLMLSFFASISWFVLAKDHSYVHTHLNFILWYFGFLQICFYIIVKRLIKFIKERK